MRISDWSSDVCSSDLQLNYGFDALGFPIDGSAGVRYVNTWGSSNSFNFRPGDASNGFQDIVEESPGRGNYTDILPSFTALLHFTPKLQLRLSYTTNVHRPSFYDKIGRASCRESVCQYV